MNSADLTINEIETGYSINIPFILKDIFKEKFPSAKWNNYTKKWEVGSRSFKRLNQFIEQAKVLEESLIELETKEMLNDEIKIIENQVNSILREIKMKISEHEEIYELNQNILELKAELKNEQENLVKLAAELKVISDEKTRNLDELINYFSGIISFNKIESARKQMYSWHGKVGRVAKEKFTEAQEIIDDEKDKLEEAGWGLTGLDFLSKANFNRADRDHPKLMPANAMSDFYKLDDLNE